MVFTPATPLSVISFLVIVAAVVVAVLSGTHWAARRTGRPAGRITGRVATGLALWVGVVSLAAASGFAEASPMPRLPMMFAVLTILSVGFGLSPVGGMIARGLPIAALVGFQAFRLPLELVLHAWVGSGTIPESMTWSGAMGANFDIISGIVALAAVPFASRSKAVAWVANLVGFGLLMNVLRVVVFSSPLPFAWPVDPPLQLAFHLPYVWIAPVCVGGALAGHVILTRALLWSRIGPQGR